MKQDLVAKLSDTQPETSLPKSRAIWVEDRIRRSHLAQEGNSAVGGAYSRKYKLSQGLL